MKHTASSPHATTQQQGRDSRQNTGPGAAATDGGRTATNAASASQRADGPAKRGEAQSAGRKAERSPKQENL